MLLRKSVFPILLALLAGFVWVGCGEDASSPPPPDNNGFIDNEPDAPPLEQGLVSLSPTDHLIRASMALRGVRPSVAELEKVKDDPNAIGGIIDEYLETPQFGETIRDLHDEAWLLRPFLFWWAPKGETFDGIDLYEFNQSAVEGPLRLIEHVIMNDKPYTEIVTANYTVADGILSSIYGMEYDGNGEEWIETRWPERGRPHAGILSSSQVFVRHYSTPLNAQRSRANAVSKALLCFDFLDRDINVAGNIDLTDPNAVNDAVKGEACASCHQTLDPLSNLFWTYEYFIFPSAQTYPVSTWRPEYDLQHRPVFSDRGKGYFGLEASGLSSLGRQIADDPRFAQCTARRFYSHFAQVDLEAVPFELVAEYQAAFEDSGMSAKALAKAVVLSDAFKVSHAATDRGAEEVVGLKKVRPRQWSRMMEELTGFVWETDVPFRLYEGAGSNAPYGRIDLMKDSLLGFEVLAGGRDDFVVNDSMHTINPTASLVFQEFAREAANFVVEQELDGSPLARKLLRDVDGEETSESAIRDQLAQLHLRLYGEFVAADSETVDLSFGLFEAALSGSDSPERAWKVVLTAMFQDPKLIYY